jgi:hypothetical protein
VLDSNGSSTVASVGVLRQVAGSYGWSTRRKGVDGENKPGGGVGGWFIPGYGGWGGD